MYKITAQKDLKNIFRASAVLIFLIASIFTLSFPFINSKEIKTGLAAIPGDCGGPNGTPDGFVDLFDYGTLSRSFGLTSGQSGFNPACDFYVDSHNIIDLLDYGILAQNFGRTTPLSPTPTVPAVSSWETGSIRYLPPQSGDIISFVSGLPHSASGFISLSSSRQNNFNTFFSSLEQSLRDTRANPAQADWCGTLTKADQAGYSLSRFYDNTSRRWFVIARDKTSEGQATFIINPDAKRDIVIESPHTGYETNTDTQGTRMLLDLSARAFLLNGADRCGSQTPTQCTPGSSNACGNYKISDVAHDPNNTFFVSHKHFSDMGTPKFIQLHGMSGSAGDNTESADGTTQDVNTNSPSVSFINALRREVTSPNSLFSCQEQGSPPQGLCATYNIEGRYTNSPSHDVCSGTVSTTSNRFVHAEQSLSLRDNNDGDGLYWKDVANAVKAVWGACSLGNGSTDCSLGAAQTVPQPCNCGSPCN